MSTNSRGFGRSFRSTFLEGGHGWRANPNRLVPSRVALTSYEPPKDLHEDEHEPHSASAKGPIKVKSVNFNVASNSENHKTYMYEITQTKQDGMDATPQLVVRRSQEFTLSITFDRDLDRDKDSIKLVLEIGDRPVASKGTMVHLTPESMLLPRHWSASIQSLDTNKMSVAILSPPDCFVGKWRLHVESSVNSEENGTKKEILRYSHQHPIYVIFNPFCKDDTVYMETEAHLDEYILNDSGKIYTGNYKQVTYKPWAFGQFENPVLECSMALLEKSRLHVQSRGNPVAIARAISGIINSQDDQGVLSGNWSGRYDDGTAPTHWTGSVRILQEYHETGNPVCYGQCWVFSGVATSVCRALGLPTRSVTNFASAQDCDGSISIDLHWDDKGNPITDSNEDSIWNFHVWNESWMSRPDLEAGYGGWQLFDATPQEISMGHYCTGPMSVRAIREGNVNLPFDGPFSFAEVNADRIHWILEDNGEWSKVIQSHAVGKKISTKRPRQEESKRGLWGVALKDDPDRLDITDQYKFEEGTEAERAAVLKANTYSTRSDIYDKKTEDVKFVLAQKDNILVGNAFDVILKIVNKSREKRSVHVYMSLETIHYTGQHIKMLKSREFSVELQPIKTEEAVMRVLAEEYLTFIVDQASFKINILAKVEETKQIFADTDDFRLRRPDLQIECPSGATVGKPFSVTVKFQNSLPEHLTKCGWMVEGPGLQKPATYKHKDLEPYDSADLKLTFTPQKSGRRQLIASFTSKELTDVTGLCEIDVKE